MTDTTQVPYEAEIMAGLLEWGKERPLWMHEALRKILCSDKLTEQDYIDLSEICKNFGAGISPIDDNDISEVTSTGNNISLLSIENLENINALAEEQSLQFAPNGLTVIYGDNGSGKSGYVRVLKHACRSRGKKPNILPNISDASSDLEQGATIKYATENGEETYHWTPGAQSSLQLNNVSIFDARSANSHVEVENPVAYTPYPMQVLSRLNTVCDRVSKDIESDISAIEAITPATIRDPNVSPETEAGRFLLNLSEKSHLETLDKLSSVSSAEHQEYVTLQADLAQDPKIVAQRIGTQVSRLKKLNADLRVLMDASADNSFQELDALQATWQTKKETSKTAADKLFKASPLPHVGEEQWHNLWEAAREYANSQAYPDKLFPKFDSEADRCVLCQQPLTKEARDRFVTFEDYIKGATKADESRSKQVYSQKKTNLENALFSLAKIQELESLIGDELGLADLAVQTRRCASIARRRLQSKLRGWAVKLRPMAPNFQEIDLAISTLSERRNQLLADEASPERKQLILRYNSLKDRLYLASIKTDIASEIDRIAAKADLKKSLKDARKRPVTDKNKALSEQLVTGALRGRFAREIDALKIGDMPIELRKTRDKDAVSHFRVVLVEHPDAKIADILSEGEHRCVALAGFLAELATCNDQAPILFDDPMSSLDHLHRDQIASRLVAEAESRQVIVFTHDLTFLWALRREAEDQGQQLGIQFRHVVREAKRPGHVREDLPLKGKNALGVTTELKTDLKQIKGQFSNLSETRRIILAKGFIEQLREAWDQGIADFISPVLGRFDNKIKGNSLPKLCVLTEDDVSIADAARARLSEDLHQKSNALNPSEVTTEQLLEEIKILEEWLSNITSRQKSVQTRGNRA